MMRHNVNKHGQGDIFGKEQSENSPEEDDTKSWQQSEVSEPATDESTTGESTTDEPVTDEPSDESGGESSNASEMDTEDLTETRNKETSVWDILVTEAIEAHVPDGEDEARNDAYQQVKPTIRKTLMANYEDLISRWMWMRKDPLHRQVMKTMRSLQDCLDLPSREALNNAIRMMKNLFNDILPLTYPEEDEDEETGETGETL